MKITMYELLGMIKDGKAPKKIKYKNLIYELDDKKMIWADEIYHEEGKDYIWLNFKHIKSLNDKVEILEEEKKIPGKLEQIVSKRDKYNSIDELAEEVFTVFETIDDLIINQNKLIDYLKSKGDE